MLYALKVDYGSCVSTEQGDEVVGNHSNDPGGEVKMESFKGQ